MKSKRISILDTLRGLTLVSMMGFHFTWDLVFIFGKEIPFMQTQDAYYWQQSICWTFIFLSGFCWSFGKHPLKRGAQIFLFGLIITLVTVFLMPEERIIYGVLTFLGSAMILTYIFQGILKRIFPAIGFLLSFILFIFTKSIAKGYIGFAAIKIMLPEFFYRNLLTTYLGFPHAGFYSTDYFAIIPWIFLFFSGYYCYRFFEKRQLLSKIPDWKEPFFSFLGRYSIWVYMIHQPLLYGIAMVYSCMSH